MFIIDNNNNYSTLCKNSKVEEELETINPLEMTPIDAMNTLYNLKQMMK